MAVNAFLQLSAPVGGAMSGSLAKQPVGEVTDQQHVGFIEVLSFQFGAENPTSIGSASGGAGAGKAKFQELTITKHIDTSTPALFAASASGAHFPTLFLTLRKAGGPKTDYLKYEFHLVFVTSIAWSDDVGGDAPVEQVTFAYGALGLSYAAQDPSGNLKPPMVATWSQVTNSVNDQTPFNNLS